MNIDRLENRYALILPPKVDRDLAPVPNSATPHLFSLTVIISRAHGLIAALIAAKNLGCTHAVALTAQTPTDPNDLRLLLKESASNPTSLILGCSGYSPHDRLAQLLLRLETGLHLRDVHGPRVYPLNLVDTIATKPGRLMGETELLVRAAWAGCPIVETPLSNRSSPGPGNPLHSRSTQQTLRDFATHARLIARALSGLRHARYHGAPARPPREPFWRSVWRWLNPLAAWRELREGGIGRHEMAVGLAAGAFIGNMPAWGFHTAISLYVARRLHLNPLAVMTGSHVSAPPMGPFLVASAMWTGHVILHGERPHWENITPFHGQFMAHAIPLLADWTLGAVIVGATVASLVFLIANFLFRFVERRSADVQPYVAMLPEFEHQES